MKEKSGTTFLLKYLYDHTDMVLKISWIVPQLLHHSVTEQINSLSSTAPGASSLPLAC